MWFIIRSKTLYLSLCNKQFCKLQEGDVNALWTLVSVPLDIVDHRSFLIPRLQVAGEHLGISASIIEKGAGSKNEM